MTNKTSLLTDSTFLQALADLPAFLLSTDADLDMAYDWVMEQLQPSPWSTGCAGSLASDEAAFDLFYDVYNETFDA